MKLFIRIVNGQPFEHPIMVDNFMAAFPEVDIDNLPSEFANFERIQKPNTCETFEVEECSYEWVNDVVKDVWTARPMTEEERTQKLQDLTDTANAVVAMMKQFTQINIDAAPSQNAKQAWINFLATINAWVLVDPVNPNIPKPPRIDANGNVLTTDSSGSAPDVIG